MHALTLVVPGLLDAVRSAPEVADSSAPALARLLALSPSRVVDADDPIGIVCRALGIEKQSDWPVAPWLARGAGLSAARGYWLCADPVNLEIQQNEVRMNRAVSDIDRGEAGALISTLNAHFAADGVRFHAPQPARWLVRMDEPQAIVTCSTGAVLGQTLRDCLPRGPDAATWLRWHSEIQMLLFEHPVNRAREAAGRVAVNSAWLWGGGTLPTVDASPLVDTLCAGAAWMRQLAAARGVAAAPEPDSLSAVSMSSSAALVWLEPVQVHDVNARLAALDAAWAGPLYEALRRRAVEAVEIVLTSRSGALVFSPRRPKFARRLTLAMNAPRLSALLGEERES